MAMIKEISDSEKYLPEKHKQKRRAHAEGRYLIHAHGIFEVYGHGISPNLQLPVGKKRYDRRRKNQEDENVLRLLCEKIFGN